MKALAPHLAPWQARWQGLARREQTLLLAAGAVVAFAVLVALAVAVCFAMRDDISTDGGER